MFVFYLWQIIPIQHNPDASPSTLLLQFFRIYAQWRWPNPVRVKHKIQHNPPPGVMRQTVWNPKFYPRDGKHLMPIITPAYPCMNSSYNVGLPQLRRLKQELERGEAIVDSILKEKAQWDDLFKENSFFQNHEHYLQIDISARNASDFRAWFGLCESRLRILIVSFECPALGVEAHPFAKFFHRKGDELDKREKDKNCHQIASFFVALRFANGLDNVDLSCCTNLFLTKINSWTERQYGMDLTIEHKQQSQLPRFVFDEEDSNLDQCGAATCADEIANTDLDPTTSSNPVTKEVLNSQSSNTKKKNLVPQSEASNTRKDNAAKKLPVTEGRVRSSCASNMSDNPSPMKRKK